MPRILRTAQADADVALYISRDNPAAAARLVATIDRALQRLADSPGLGPERPELQPLLRSYPVGNYLLFHRPLEDGIVLLRVVHGARDLQRLFAKP